MTAKDSQTFKQQALTHCRLSHIPKKCHQFLLKTAHFCSNFVRLLSFLIFVIFLLSEHTSGVSPVIFSSISCSNMEQCSILHPTQRFPSHPLIAYAGTSVSDGVTKSCLEQAYFKPIQPSIRAVTCICLEVSL